MRAAIYDQFRGPVAVRNVSDPAPPDDGVVISVEATGLCRSDWHGWMGHDPDIRLPLGEQTLTLEESVRFLPHMDRDASLGVTIINSF